MNAAPTTESMVEPHEPHWLTQNAFQVLALLFFATQGTLAWAVYHSNYWLAVPLVLVSSHLMHGMLIGFHEATHGLLRKSRVLNEIDGVIIGALSFMSFSLYRVAHQLHHMHLASEKDEELWPFIHPEMPRWKRVGAAVLELTMGAVFTPYLFIRTFLRAGSPIRQKKVRRRIWIELIGMLVFWAVAITLIAVFDGWNYFLWLHVIPAWIAGNAQSLRKYVEHVGLTGATVNGSTRSIVAEGWVAKFMCFTLLHEPYHGVHHWRPGLPHPELPMNAEALDPKEEDEKPPFRTYTAALVDLLVNLPDPRVGAQWRGIKRTTRRELAEQGMN